MYARVSRYEVPTNRIEDDVRGVGETQRRIAAMPGSQGLFYLVDRQSGKTMSITLWDDERAMWESEDSASQLRDETTAASEAKLISIERYEVATQPAMVGSSAR